MPDRKEALKAMLQNLINDKPEQASLDLHGYLTDKMRDMVGTQQEAAAVDDDAAGDGSAAGE